MSSKNKSYKRFDFDEYARTCAPDDFLGQTRRTVGGVPISEEQIKMIIDKIHSSLDLNPDDRLLDIACGNGAMSHYLFDSIFAYLGIDLSEYLISVAKKNFEVLPNFRFMQQGAAEYLRHGHQPESYTKILCYGSFQYFPASDAAEVLQILFDKYTNAHAVFIGNMPDRDRVATFYKENLPTTEELLDSYSQVGIWRTRKEFVELAENAGWNVKITTMPASYHASHYRMDALLIR